MKTIKYSVLTYIMGNYEYVRELPQKDEDVEYLLITDNPNLTSQTWTVVCDTNLTGNSWDNVIQVKYNPFNYCHSDICVILDGSIQINKTITPIIDYFNKHQYDMCSLIHPHQNDFVSEYIQWIKLKFYNFNHAQKLWMFFKCVGYDLNYKGLFEEGFRIIRNNTISHNILYKTFQLCNMLGENGHMERISQIIWSYVLNSQYSFLKVLPICRDMIDCDFMNICVHGSDEKIHVSLLDNYYMFNKPVTLIHPSDIISDIDNN